VGVMPTAPAGTLEERLRSVGLRVTAPRLAVLREFEHHAHADVETMVSAVRTRHHAISTQAVYKQIEEMVRAGLGEPNPGGDADDAKVVGDPVVETATNAAH
jgi:hypothetical protein